VPWFFETGFFEKELHMSLAERLGNALRELEGLAPQGVSDARHQALVELARAERDVLHGLDYRLSQLELALNVKHAPDHVSQAQVGPGGPPAGDPHAYGAGTTGLGGPKTHDQAETARKFEGGGGGS
jgi:hypothetical protein